MEFLEPISIRNNGEECSFRRLTPPPDTGANFVNGWQRCNRDSSIPSDSGNPDIPPDGNPNGTKKENDSLQDFANSGRFLCNRAPRRAGTGTTINNKLKKNHNNNNFACFWSRFR
jgi:hypothetical protein